MFVLDEADEMLSRGFKDQIYDVFRYMPQDIQVCVQIYASRYSGMCSDICLKIFRYDVSR
jgi:hypothetical protein